MNEYTMTSEYDKYYGFVL